MNWTTALLAGSAMLGTACASVLGLDEFGSGEGGSAPQGSQSSTSSDQGSVASSTSSTTASTASSGGGSASTNQGGAGGTGGAGGEGGDGGQGGDLPAPTCTDGVQNGNEGGVDCGGNCPACEVPCPTTTHQCAPSIPDWNGPVALVDEATGCEAPFPDSEIELRGDLEALEASCDCTCAPPAVACGALSTGTFNGANCIDLVGGETTPANQCISAANSSSSHTIRLGTTTSSCGTGVVAADIPPPEWQTNLLACGGFGEAGTCTGSAVCVPTPQTPFQQAAVCIFRAGEVACPDQYPTRITYHDDFVDDRSCPSSCNCTLDEPGTCQVVVSRHTGTSCNGTTLSPRTVENEETDCAITGTTRSMRPATPTVDAPGLCAEGPAELAGSVTPVGPTTVCCQ